MRKDKVCEEAQVFFRCGVASAAIFVFVTAKLPLKESTDHFSVAYPRQIFFFLVLRARAAGSHSSRIRGQLQTTITTYKVRLSNVRRECAKSSRVIDELLGNCAFSR